MRVLYLDCFSGISGDMTVGALCDLGVNPSAFEWELAKLEIGDFHLHFERQNRRGIEGVKFGVHAGAVHTHDQDEAAGALGHAHETAPEHEHGRECGCEHDHAPGNGGQDVHEHAHEHSHSHAHESRSHADIQALIGRSELSDFVKRRALGIFGRIAVAEAKIHGVPLAAVAFHEVGALDSIADIVCACVGIEALGAERVFVSPLADGRGWVDCAHGIIPAPAPATLEILRGFSLGQLDEPHELITPTGAAIAAEFGETFGPMPRLKIEKIGYGIGARELARRPNVLRAVLGEWEPAVDA